VDNIMATLIRLYHMSRSGQLRATREGATKIVLRASDVSVEHRAEAILARIRAQKKAAETVQAMKAVTVTFRGDSGGGAAPQLPPTSIAGVVASIAEGQTSFVDTDWSLLETDVIRFLLRDVALECDRLQQQLATCIDGDGQAATAAAAGAAGGARTIAGHVLGGDGIAASRELLLLMIPQQIAQCARLMLQLARAESKVLLVQQHLYLVGPAPMPCNDEKGGTDEPNVREEDEDDGVTPTDTDTTAAEEAEPAVLEHVLSQLETAITTQQAALAEASAECHRLLEAAIVSQADATDVNRTTGLQQQHQQALRMLRFTPTQTLPTGLQPCSPLSLF
jgi:hypothetical protein